jgi:hypothetical protein
MRWLALVVLLTLGAPTALAEDTFPATETAIAAALCAGHGPCRLESVLYAGRRHGMSLAVARVRRGGVCAAERAYRDELITVRGHVVQQLGTLVIGPEPCLEWQLSHWSRSGSELTFEYGFVGAPMLLPPGVTGRTVLHVRPWPLAIVSATDGVAPIPTPPTPARGPLVVISME